VLESARQATLQFHSSVWHVDVTLAK